MTATATPAAFAGIDWATEKHDACMLDSTGEIVAEQCFPASACGLNQMADWMLRHANGAGAAGIAVAIETPHGPVTEFLVARGFDVNATNPKQLDRFRDRFSPSGAKDDRRDARVLADSLRTDPRAFRGIEPLEEDLVVLREWVRSHTRLTQENVRLTNQLREQLRRFFPQVLDLGDDPGSGWITDLLRLIPVPEQARVRRPQSIARILKAHRIRRWEAKDVLAVLRTPPLTVAAGTTMAARSSIGLLLPAIELTRRQLGECRKTIDGLLASISRRELEVEGRKNGPSNVEVLFSLPGIGRMAVAVLLAEASDTLRERDYHALRALAGIAPVTRRSGKQKSVLMRRACSRLLRTALHHAAGVAAMRDPAWKAKYDALKARGHGHSRACRGIADSMLRVMIAMLKSGTLYQQELHPVRTA